MVKAVLERSAILAGACVVIVASFCALPALAQKAADTLRIPYDNPISTTLLYDDTNPETDMTSLAVYDDLVCYDRKAGSFVPALAKSWRQVDDRTIEFQLRDDVQFHDGTKLTADDVVYTLNWIIDPASKQRFAQINFGWLERAERIDDHAVRIIAKEPTPLAMINLATAAPILPAALHRAYENKTDFGRKTPIGTGPYRVVPGELAKGITLVRNDAYHGSSCKPAGSIAKIQVMPIPDRQTQIAQLTIGGIDMVQTQTKDEPDMLASNPALRVTAVEGVGLQFLVMDAAGRSGLAALTDQRVRRAIAQAVDRQFVARSVLAGGESVHAADALCTPDQLSCAVSQPPPAYDVAAAKAALAEAGYPDGFDTEITALPGTYPIADALSGELRKIGIRASVDKATYASLRQKQADGKIQLATIWWTVLKQIDASSLVTYLFDDTPRNYTRDATIAQLAKRGLATVDPTARKEVYRQLFDRVNEVSFALPIAIFPNVIVHTKDLAIDGSPSHAQGLSFFDMRWK
jgi:peptide/nickel transport system substrate-binding protein